MQLLPSYAFQISYGPKDDRLKDFYIPALERSVSFDRSTGFFSSAALAIAAAGIVRLIGNGGRMRLLCGAQLSPADVEAVRRGEELKGIVERVLVGCLADPSDASMKARLEALAWMVAQGTLEMRVVLPKGKDGLPLSASEAREYYHPKEGLFRDAEGNRLAFSGSSNDSANGWQWNYEVFNVYTTWPHGSGENLTPALNGFVNQTAHRFEALWEGREDDWIALSIPQAAREKLLRLAPSQAPTRDPLEPDATVPRIDLPVGGRMPRTAAPSNEEVAALQRERLLFRFLREAPYLPGADRIGIETSTVRPWPHQQHVIGQTVARYPESFLFCDEVGLGKTVEVGLALRQLVVTGRVQRALILTPKSVLKQWQEELYEKAVLNVPRFDGGQVLDYFDRPVQTSGPVWEMPFLLASSQLAKREERQAELLSATPWDLIVVDEAHHARRKDFLTDRYRPNRLMELLAGAGGRAGLRTRSKCLFLLTATPMQVDPVEVWDLLKVLGLGGRWGALQENFLDFYAALRQPPAERDWEHLLTLLDDELAAGGTLDPGFAEKAERALGLVSWSTLKALPRSPKKKAAVAKLTELEKTWLTELVRRHTPLRRMMWRNTRRLLRRYKERGLLSGNVPRRDPKNVWIELKKGPGGEQELYDRIEEYITDFYRKYEAERKGLGFVMTVYRRRLTSSFAALTKSLENRASFLRGARADAGFTDDDLEQEELDRDVLEELNASTTGSERSLFKGELAYVEDFLHDLKQLGSDSKFERLVDDLSKVFRKFETVIVFTQYTDTMDDLRERLRVVYGSQVACYSGRGGELWDGTAWVPRSKEEIKEEFRLGERVKLLLCTEAASEGLNLQTCGILFNYDMPWNPMRVEQRIGRIDRIGQTFETVHVRNYFLANTVEATVYQRLEDRIGWFEDVVGELQPILNRVGRTIEELAMLHGADRVRRLEEELGKLRAELDEKTAQGLDLDAAMEELEAAATLPPAPVTLQQIETALVGSTSVGRLLKPDSEHTGSHVLTWRGAEHRVTFRADLFDRFPNSLALLSYGNPLLEELLEAAGEPDAPDGPRGTALLSSAMDPRVSLFVGPGEPPAVVSTLETFQASLVSERSWEPIEVEAARRLFIETRARVLDQAMSVREARRRAESVALEERARRLLVQAALVRIAESATGDLFSAGGSIGFGAEAVPSLASLGVPFKGLLKIAGECPPALPTDPFYASVLGRPATALDRKLEALREEGREVLLRYVALGHTPIESLESPDPPLELAWLTAERVGMGSSDVSGRPASVLPFRRVDLPSLRPFENAIPYFALEAAAGLFGRESGSDGNVAEELLREPDRCEWAEPLGRTRPARGLFIARVTGESMNRRIPNGSYCVFRVGPQGSRHGSVVLAQHRAVSDVETGGHFTVKVYTSEKTWSDEEQWRHTKIVLRPDSTDASFAPITIPPGEEESEVVVAVLVEVLG